MLIFLPIILHFFVVLIVAISVCPHPFTCAMNSLLIIRSVCTLWNLNVEAQRSSKSQTSFERAATLFTYKQTNNVCNKDLSHSSMFHRPLKQHSLFYQYFFYSLCLMLEASTVSISISIDTRLSGQKSTTKKWHFKRKFTQRVWCDAMVSVCESGLLVWVLFVFQVYSLMKRGVSVVGCGCELHAVIMGIF